MAESLDAEAFNDFLDSKPGWITNDPEIWLQWRKKTHGSLIITGKTMI